MVNRTHTLALTAYLRVRSQTTTVRARPMAAKAELAVGDERHTGVAADLVDDLQYALAIGSVLYPELLNESAVVD